MAKIEVAATTGISCDTSAERFKSAVAGSGVSTTKQAHVNGVRLWPVWKLTGKKIAYKGWQIGYGETLKRSAKIGNGITECLKQGPFLCR